jgi:hypothetical protein
MATQPPAPKKKSLSIYRLVLLVILVGALGALGYDQWAKYRMGEAFKAVDELAKKNEDASVMGLANDKIHAELGQPTRTFPTSDRRHQVEEYDFPGVFYVHRLIVTYRSMPKGEPLYEDHQKKSIFRISAAAE